MVGLSLGWVSTGLLFLLLLLQCSREVLAVEVTVNNNKQDYSLTLATTDILSLACAVQNHTAEEELLWYREGQLLDLKKENQKNISTVCVFPVSSGDNRVTFSCQLQRNTSIQVSVVLDVQFPPQLSGYNNLTVEEGKDVKLTCNVKSNPQAAVVWYKDNSTLILEEGRYHQSLTSEFFELAISKTRKSDNGTYTCVARYENKTHAEILSKDFFLTVEDRRDVFPLEAVIAAVVVVLLTVIFGIAARRKRIFKCFKAGTATTL
ncbi:transmembrane and immunoglobulin domain-containing protein 1 [Rhinatrema bivittatum]|uniref:transmembrane and immunoglobulin domain-containing protein 1 n=1 Tax=Rhinatrema bivittatum TaxID=194408 RepID=UPI0011269ABB|nr:transmembrane and immunoglobulin domain-containing protein 1 [Rhinatrema bivittatum]